MRIALAVVGIALAVLVAAAEPPKDAKPVEVVLDGLKSTTPGEWKAEKPSNLLRAYQFKVPRAVGDKEDGEVYVLTTVHGTPAENIARLKELFVLPTSLAKEKAVREWDIKNSKATLTCLDIQGTYYVKSKPVDTAAKEVRPDYRMIAAVWMSKDAAFSIRMVGPKKTVEAHAKEFDEWLHNFK
jgi:hypothetical protein